MQSHNLDKWVESYHWDSVFIGNKFHLVKLKPTEDTDRSLGGGGLSHISRRTSSILKQSQNIELVS